MDNRFLIDTIPESAVYTMPAIFFNGITDEKDFFDRVQMADLRWTEADIDRIAQSRVSSEFARIFEIKDAAILRRIAGFYGVFVCLSWQRGAIILSIITTDSKIRLADLNQGTENGTATRNCGSMLQTIVGMTCIKTGY